MSTAGRADGTMQIYLQIGTDAKTDWATDFSEMKQSGIELRQENKIQCGADN